jgi:hypothetical protein
MSNRILTSSIIAKRSLAQLINGLGVVQRINRDYQPEFKKVGESVSYRLPTRTKRVTGMALVSQPMVELTRSLTLTGWEQQSLNYDQRMLALSIDEMDSRHIKPRMRTIANAMDKSPLDMYWKVANCAGAAGTQPSTAAVFTNARAKLRAIGTPEDDMYTLCINPITDAALQNGVITPATSAVYNSEMAMSSFVKGQLAFPVAGMTTLTTANLPNHTFGTFWDGTTITVTATALVHDFAANTTTIEITGGATTGTVLKGDLMTIAAVNSVNQMTYQNTGYAQDFTVVANATASGGTVSIKVSPCMNDGTLTTTNPENGASVSLAAYQNVTAVAASSAVVTPRGTGGATYTQDLIMHRDAFTFVQVPIESPFNMEGGVTSFEGFSVTMSRGGDIQNYQSIMRWDTLYGTDCTYPDLAMRVLGAALS